MEAAGVVLSLLLKTKNLSDFGFLTIR